MRPVWLLLALAVAAVSLTAGPRLIRRLIEREEGRKNYAYLDSAGKWTIGVGHLILPHEQYLLQYTKASPAPDAVINRLLDADTASARRAVDSLGLPLTNNQRAALVSLVFNIGAGAFAASTLRKKLLARDWTGAADEMLRWKNAGGQPVLLARRERERELFLSA